MLTNWFTGYDAEFAQIYTSPGLPINSCCEQYFQITDSQMVKSIFGGGKAGHQVSRVESLQRLQKPNRTLNAKVYMEL